MAKHPVPLQPLVTYSYKEGQEYPSSILKQEWMRQQAVPEMYHRFWFQHNGESRIVYAKTRADAYTFVGCWCYPEFEESEEQARREETNYLTEGPPNTPLNVILSRVPSQDVLMQCLVCREPLDIESATKQGETMDAFLP